MMARGFFEEEAVKEPPYPRAGYAWYVVAILTLIYVFSFIDRQILNLLVKPIRRDLAISDTEMSLLMGLSFALFYTFFGMPMGRLADARSRRAVIAIGLAGWSLFTAACGLARNFTQMLLMRMGVGLGEAALSPAAYSMISDYFPPNRRATAISVYGMGIYIGSGLAFLLGGVVVGLASGQETVAIPLLGSIRPWQFIFFAVGLPGVLAALLMYTVREPLRRERMGRSGEIALREVLGYVRRHKWTFFCHNMSFALISFGAYAAAAWNPTFFMRSYGWSAARAGIVIGIVVSIAGSLGIVAGGVFADRLAGRGYRDSKMRVALYVTLACIPFAAFTYLAPNALVASLMIAPLVFLTSAPFGIAPAAIQEITPNAMRGQASALYLFVVNLVGLGLGPTAAALITDFVFRDDAAVAYSLLIVVLASSMAAAVLLWTGLRHFIRTLDCLSKGVTG